MNESQIRQLIREELKNAQYRVGGVPMHIHNGIDSPTVFLPFVIRTGNGAPSGVATEGTLYINLTASSTTTRFYISTGTTWGYFTASA